MSTVEVTYYCPHCGTVVALERDAYLADKSVTPYPLEGWEYVAPTDDYEAEDADGVRFVCGESDGCRWRPDAEVEDDSEANATDVGCGEPFYLSFVRYEEGEAVDSDPESEYVQLAEGTVPTGPRGPSGPSGP